MLPALGLVLLLSAFVYLRDGATPGAVGQIPDPGSITAAVSANEARQGDGPPLAIDGTPAALRALGAELLPDAIRQLEAAPTASQEAWEAYLAGTAALVPGNYTEALLWFERAVESDPGFIEAQVSLSMLHTLMTGVPVSSASEHREQALAIDPAYGYAHAVLGAAQHNHAQWERAVDEYRLAREFGADVDDMEMYALLQLSLGDFASAQAMLRATLTRNPSNMNARGVLMVAEELLGNRQAATEVYRQGETLYARSWWGDITGVWLALGRGDSGFIANMRDEYPA